jgi:hypothetical protein
LSSLQLLLGPIKGTLEGGGNLPLPKSSFCLV